MCVTIYFAWTLCRAAQSGGSVYLFATGDEGKAFTDAGYVVAVGGILVGNVHHRHNH